MVSTLASSGQALRATQETIRVAALASRTSCANSSFIMISTQYLPSTFGALDFPV